MTHKLQQPTPQEKRPSSKTLQCERVQPQYSSTLYALYVDYLDGINE
jgi:hypothetical protein